MLDLSKNPEASGLLTLETSTITKSKEVLMIHVGINLHTNNMLNVAINDNGQVVREANLSTSSTALDDFFNTLDEPVRAVVECTSSWYRLSD